MKPYEPRSPLLCLLVRCVLLAESAILVNFHSVRMILLLLSKEIVTLFALGTSQSDFGTLCSHGYSPPKSVDKSPKGVVRREKSLQEKKA